MRITLHIQTFLFVILLGKLLYATVILHGNLVEWKGIDLVYQIPSITLNQLKGVIFLANGCGNHAGTGWPKGPECVKCHTQPFSQALIQEGLRQNYVVLAGTAHPNSKNHCWGNADHSRLVELFHMFYTDILKSVSNDSLVTRLQLHFVGVGTGGLNIGYFLQNKTAIQQLEPLKVASVALIIAPMKLNPIYTMTNKFPIPTYFVTMKRYKLIHAEIQRQLPLFQFVNLSIVDPEPLSKEYFLQRSMGRLTEEESERLVTLFKQHQLVDDQYHLLHDPISKHLVWRQVIKSYAPDIYEKHLTGPVDNDFFQQLLKRSYAQRGFTMLQYPKIFQFFDQQFSATPET